jgi:hypothetical protein
LAFDPSSLLDVSYLDTFLGGAALGATGKYLADLFTDRRREQEATRKELRQFKDLQARMPDLFKAMAESLRSDAVGWPREFMILPNPGVTFGGLSKPRVRYNESEHPNLRSCFDLLRTAGYFEDATIQDIPIFKMREHFVPLLKERA